MNDNDYQKYVKVFETWNENRTPLTLRWKDEEYTYYPDSSEEFRPCYLETIPENEQVRFLKQGMKCLKIGGCLIEARLFV